MYGTILAIAAAALLASCSPAEEKPEPKPESTIDKVEDEAKKILDEIEGKTEKE